MLRSCSAGVPRSDQAACARAPRLSCSWAGWGAHAGRAGSCHAWAFAVAQIEEPSTPTTAAALVVSCPRWAAGADRAARH